MPPAALARLAPQRGLHSPDAVPPRGVRLEREAVRASAADMAVGGVDEVRQPVAALDLQADRHLARLRREVVHAKERGPAPAVEEREHRPRPGRHDRPLAPADLGALLPQPDHPGRPAQERLAIAPRSEEHTSELQSRQYLVCRLLLEKKKKIK